MQVKCDDEIKFERIKEENPIEWQIISKIREIDNMNEMYFDTSWERTLLKCREVRQIISTYLEKMDK